MTIVNSISLYTIKMVKSYVMEKHHDVFIGLLC